MGVLAGSPSPLAVALKWEQLISTTIHLRYK
jgi:hypothetical protein